MSRMMNFPHIRNILEVFPDPAWIIDKDAVITNANRALSRILGYPEEEIIGRNAFHFIDPAYIPHIRGELTEIHACDRKTYKSRFLRKNGPPITVLLTNMIVENPGDEEGMVLSLIKAINEPKRTLDKLIKEKEDAEELVRSQSIFLASISHEIRTPLTAIIGFLDIVMDNGLIPSEVKEYILDAKTGADSLLGIINDLLDFSRIQVKEFDIDKRPFSLSELMTQFDSFSRMLLNQSGKDIDLHAVILEDCNLHINGDPDRLKQVLINFFTNALKFTDSGYIEYGVSIVTDKNNDFLKFYVEDTGSGIKEEKQKSIFQPFRQAEKKASQKQGGIVFPAKRSFPILTDQISPT